jgi:hypothetical protein
MLKGVTFYTISFRHSENAPWGHYGEKKLGTYCASSMRKGLKIYNYI